MTYGKRKPAQQSRAVPSLDSDRTATIVPLAGTFCQRLQGRPSTFPADSKSDPVFQPLDLESLGQLRYHHRWLVNSNQSLNVLEALIQLGTVALHLTHLTAHLIDRLKIMSFEPFFELAEHTTYLL